MGHAARTLLALAALAIAADCGAAQWKQLAKSSQGSCGSTPSRSSATTSAAAFDTASITP
jgi:hypothetical protein